MPQIQLTFSKPINVSVQANPNATPSNPDGADIVYFSQANTVGIHSTASQIKTLGPVVSTTTNSVTCSYASGTTLPLTTDFIMFAKDRVVNMSSLLGYFAEFRVRNDSKDKAELYSINVDVFESSK